MQEGRILVVENKLKKWRTGSRKQQKKRKKKKFKELQEKIHLRQIGCSVMHSEDRTIKHSKNIKSIIQENYSEIKDLNLYL